MGTDFLLSFFQIQVYSITNTHRQQKRLQTGLKEISTFHNKITRILNLYINYFVCYVKSCKNSKSVVNCQTERITLTMRNLLHPIVMGVKFYSKY
jgi:hypothetical protein